MPVDKIIKAGALAAAGLYFLYATKKGEKEREKMRGWMLMMKGEVAHKMENIKDLSEKSYKKVVDDTAKKFKKMKNISSSEVSKLSDELKKHWSKIAKEAGLNK